MPDFTGLERDLRNITAPSSSKPLLTVYLEKFCTERGLHWGGWGFGDEKSCSFTVGKEDRAKVFVTSPGLSLEMLELTIRRLAKTPVEEW